jgi:glycosyltransferase involved in cell wall biosynthesis
VQYLDPRVSRQAEVFQSKRLSKKAGLIYHHSIGSNLTEFVIQHAGPKCLVYHNITPAEFFRPYDSQVAHLLEEGRNDLKRLAQHFHLSVGDSEYNASELAEFGFSRPWVLPICVDPGKWAAEPDADLMYRLQDGRANLLFVGRISPNKCQHHLIEAFDQYLTMDPDARLILVGDFSPDEVYYQQLLASVEMLELRRRVIFTGKVSDAQLQSYYRTAHVFWSMSEHEGFGVPLVEAMWFDIPVLAFKSSAVPETLGIGGIMFTEKDRIASVAAMAKLLVHDYELRGKVIAAQQKRRQDFLPASLLKRLQRLITDLEKTTA